MKARNETDRHESRGPRGGILSRFGRNRSGSTAIEFTALAIPFSLLVFAILESCISFAGQQVMANATDDIARRIRTGQIRPADLDSPAKLEKLVCDRLEIIVADDCPGLEVDLREYTSFAEAASAKFKITDGEIVLTKNGTPDPTGFIVDPGPSMSKNMLRVFYKWPVMTDFMRKRMSNLDDGKTLHFATATWQNEPFDD